MDNKNLNIKKDSEVNVPNEITMQAIKEGKEILNDETASGYSTIDDLKRALK